ncbi:peptide-methionine (R)-S-oxide reductase MsrB [Pedobacter gandavensis]|uniref:peptide-methionine (R)-S-oxide reductase n=1 Tax=Pedobacter gandavensis TaxID=2679963 RepID=A0ABR6ESG0_9SPHI|nr:peptide-methionine (R)-S-oxide reductase MsrB [Pedobacter gandavensis]MBB2148202.1 peptide-methionine (R)-S-oxide reductase MsrB [Pedobacter gandavensis]
MRKLNFLMIPLLVLALNACSQNPASQRQKGMTDYSEDTKLYPDAKPAQYWKKILSPQAYEIMVNKGTETPFKNPYWDNHKKGVYVSAATGKALFSSDAKFESGTGWPSFFQPIDAKLIRVVKDTSDGMVRDEVVEASTGLHLGHVFDDGPQPTGKRYCMNSYAFKFIPVK